MDDVLLNGILDALPRRRIGVLGDLFLDRYLDLDSRLTEPSVETGLDAYQVTHVRSYPGAAGTVINNLAALGVGRIVPISVIGDDGEGFELRRCLARLSAVHADHVLSSPRRFTPTYTKPMLCQPDEPPRELNRLDIKNRTPLPPAEEQFVLDRLEAIWPNLDALAVLDQVSEEDCGVLTRAVRRRLEALTTRHPAKIVLADSRERIGLFIGCALKPNQAECHSAVPGATDIEAAALTLAQRVGRPVFCTRGKEGILIADPASVRLCGVPAYPVRGPIDPVGAGDSTSAGILCALASGCDLEAAAAFGNLVASITVQQIGVTGVATPEQLRARWRQVGGARA